MVVPTNSQVALLSIKPRYASAILAGAKRVEFRRQPFARDLDFVLIYASSPIQRLVGYFRVDGVDQDTPSRLWKRYGGVAGLSESEFASYTAGADQPVAIRVGRVVALGTPRPLHDLSPIIRPPQSFCYVDSEKFAEIVATRKIRAA